MLDLLYDLINRAGTTWTIVGAALAIVIGVVIVLFPPVLAWIVGVLRVLAGITLFGVMLGLVAKRMSETPPAQTSPSPTDTSLAEHHSS
jgi:ABC-type multidrug transport system permease subunit